MIFNNLFNPFKKLDAKLDTKEINQIAIFKANRLVVHDLLILDDGSTNTFSIYDRSSIVGSTCFFAV